MLKQFKFILLLLLVATAFKNYTGDNLARNQQRLTALTFRQLLGELDSRKTQIKNTQHLILAQHPRMMMPGFSMIPLFVDPYTSGFRNRIAENDIHCKFLQTEIDRRVAASEIRLAWVGAVVKVVVAREGASSHLAKPSRCVIS